MNEHKPCIICGIPAPASRKPTCDAHRRFYNRWHEKGLLRLKIRRAQTAQQLAEYDAMVILLTEGN